MGFLDYFRFGPRSPEALALATTALGPEFGVRDGHPRFVPVDDVTLYRLRITERDGTVDVGGRIFTELAAKIEAIRIMSSEYAPRSVEPVPVTVWRVAV